MKQKTRRKKRRVAVPQKNLPVAVEQNEETQRPFFPHMPPRKETPFSIQSFLSNLNSINLAKLLDGFFTFRHTLKNVSHSIQQMEKILDSTYQFFDVAKSFRGNRFSGPGLPSFLQPPSSDSSTQLESQKNRSSQGSDAKNLIDDLEVPKLQLPSPNNKSQENDFHPLAGLLQNIDISQVMKLLQNPMIQKLLSNLMRPKPAAGSEKIQIASQKTVRRKKKR